MYVHVCALYIQEVDGYDHQLHQLQMECEDIKQEKKQSSITASDMDREINRLKRVICIYITRMCTTPGKGHYLS